MKEEMLAPLGYQLLMILSIIDGEYEDAEVDVIQRFLREQYNEFDIEEQNDILERRSRGDLIEQFNKAARGFKVLSRPEQREEFLRFATGLIAADGEVSGSESDLLESLAATWGLDLPHILSGATISEAGEEELEANE